VDVMTSANAAEGTGVCAFPGCTRPVRPRSGDGGGKPPIYCDLINETTGKYAHTALTAARERVRLERAGATGLGVADSGERPASAARERAATLLDQFQSSAASMAAQLAEAIAAFEQAGDPESVSAELTAARRMVERTRLETDERVTAAESARDEAEAIAAARAGEAREAAQARDEAIAELETAETALAEARDELAAERQRTAEQLDTLRAEHTAELDRVRAAAAEQVRAAQADAEQHVQAAQEQARSEIETARARFDEQLVAAETKRDRAVADVTRAQQAAQDITAQRDELRADLKQLRADHRDELTALRREHRDELTAERQRADVALQTLRAEHAREIEALNRALNMLRASHTEQPVAAPATEASDTPPAATPGGRRTRKGQPR
jgi:colicin import membrane protein